MELAVVRYNVTPSIEGGNEISEFSNAALFYGREVIRRAQVSWNTNPKDGEGGCCCLNAKNCESQYIFRKRKTLVIIIFISQNCYKTAFYERISNHSYHNRIMT